jgi:hypothetical protein
LFLRARVTPASRARLGQSQLDFSRGRRRRSEELDALAQKTSRWCPAQGGGAPPRPRRGRGRRRARRGWSATSGGSRRISPAPGITPTAATDSYRRGGTERHASWARTCDHRIRRAVQGSGESVDIQSGLHEPFSSSSAVPGRLPHGLAYCLRTMILLIDLRTQCLRRGFPTRGRGAGGGLGEWSAVVVDRRLVFLPCPSADLEPVVPRLLGRPSRGERRIGGNHSGVLVRGRPMVVTRQDGA